MKEQTSYNDKRKKAIIILIILLLLLAFLGSFFFIRGRLNASAAEQAGIAEENGNNEAQNNEVSSTTNTENNTVTNTTETLQAVTTNTRRENNGSTNANSGTNNGNDNENDNSNNNQNTNNSNNNPSNDNQNGNEEPADTTAPEITGIEDGKVYAENVTATINADDLEKAICKFVAEDGTESEYEFSSGKEFTESGKYILIVTDKSGNKTEISFTIDKNAPEITGVENGKIYNVDVTPVISDKNLKKVTYKLNDGEENDLEEGTTLVEEGIYTITAEDEAGNKVEISFEIDKTAPVYTNLGIIRNKTQNDTRDTSYAKDGDSVRVLVAFAEKLAVEPTVKVGDKEYVATYRPLSSNEAENVFYYMADIDVTEEIPEGKIEFSIEGYADVAGNVGTTLSNTDINMDYASVTVDRTAPVLTVKDESVGTDPYYSKISFKLYDNNAIVKYILNGTERTCTPNNYSDANYDNIKSLLVEGENTITLVDIAGNETTKTFIYDTTKPTITWNGNVYEDGAETIYTNGRFTVNASDENGISKVYSNNHERRNGWSASGESKYTIKVVDMAGNEAIFTVVIDKTMPKLKINGTEYADSTEKIYLNAENYEFENVDKNADKIYVDENEVTDAIDLAEGTYSVKLTDKAGNEVTYTLVVDRTAPVLTVKDESVGTDPYYSKISFKLYDNNAVVKYILNGTERTCTPNNYSDANYGNINNLLVEGENTITLVDIAGNETTKTFIYDTTKPTITWNGNVYEDGAETIYTNGRFTVNASDENGISKVYSNNHERKNGWSASGESKYTIKVVDMAGNEAIFTVVIDKTMPKLKINGTEYADSTEKIYLNAENYEFENVDKNADKIYVDENEVTDAIDLAEGKYLVKLTDKAGNEVTYTLVVDRTAPVLTVKDESVGTDPYYSKISFKLYDNNAVVKYILNGTERTCTPNNYSDANYGNINNLLVEGENTITLVDIAGNETTRTFIYDTTAPVYTTLGIVRNKTENDTRNQAYAKDGDSVRILISFAEKLAVEPTIKIGEAEYLATYRPLSSDESNNVFFYMADIDVTTEIPEGEIKFSVNGYADAAGNVGKTLVNGDINRSEFSKVIVDRTAPVLTVKDESIGTDPYYSKISFSLYDNNAVVKYILNGTEKTCTPNNYSDANYGNIKNLLVEGENTITLVDIAGNEVTRTFVYDRTAPVLTVKDESVGTDPYYSRISFSLYDNNAVVKYILNGTERTCTPNNYSDANYGNIKNLLVEGENTITLVDIAGNETTRTFIYDITSPTAVVTYSNDNGNAMTNQDVTVTLTASEDIKDIEGWTKVDSKTFTKVYGENGKHSVEIEDKAGNKTTINYEVKRIDKVAPVIDLSNTKSTFEVGVDVYTYPENITIYDESDKAISVSKLNIQWFKANADGSKGEPVANFEWNTTLKNRELGDYYIYYYIRDKAGNLAETHRIVTLQDTTKPEIIINGNSEEHISLGSEYTDAGFTVSDNRDEASQINTVTKITWYSLTGDSSEVGQVNKDIEGRYNIDYIATDRAGNKQKVTRLVYVEDNTTLDFDGISYDTSVNGEVTVTITANKKIKLNSGWEYTDSSKKAMYRVYTENTEYLGEDITVSDLKGATKVANILVTSIVTNGTRNVNVTSKAGFDKLVVDMRSGVTFKNAVINIDTDIDLSNENWTSIYAGQNNNIFSNTIIDGKEHKITGMKVSRNPATNDGRSEATQYGIGFIGDLNGSLTIKNLTFDGAQVIDANGGTGSNYSQHYAGVVVGHTDAKLKLENVNVSNSKVLNSWQCGGLVGFSGEDITFDNCSVSNTFVGGTNATSGALFGMGSVNVNINNCKANKVKLYSDGLTWDSVQKIDSIYWIGDNYKYHSHSGKTISIDADSTITDVSIVDTLE